MSDYDVILANAVDASGDEVLSIVLRDGRKVRTGYVRASSLSGVRISNVVETGYTLVSSDSYKRFLSSDPVSVTVPHSSSVPFPMGKIIYLEQTGAGTVTVIAGPNVTINASGSSGGMVASSGQYAVMRLTKVETDVWTLSGDRM